jgi:hypothetical protein
LRKNKKNGIIESKEKERGWRHALFFKTRICIKRYLEKSKLPTKLMRNNDDNCF